MTNVKWIKLSTSMFDDEKIKLIEQMPDADTILIIWMKLLTQAGKTNSSGYIFLNENIPYTDEMLSTIFNRPLSTIRLALKTFENLGMIGIDDSSFISILNWEKHQNIEGMERIRLQNRERKRRQREREKMLPQGKNVTSRDSHATEEELEEDIDIDKDINNKHIRDLFDHYLSKNIIQHRKLTNSMRTAIKARLREYSFDELIKAIDNYASVLQSDSHWFTHKYPLADFMRDKDIRKFLPEADPLNNFKKNNSIKNGVHNNDSRNYEENVGDYGVKLYR